MIKVNDFVLNTSVEGIIRTLRTSLHEEKIDLLRDVKDTLGNIMVTCPVHKDGKERKPSCGISKETGVCHCFTCGYSANLTEFISNCFNKNDGGLYGDFWLRKNFLSFEMDERPEIKIDRRRRELPKKQYTYVPDMVLEQYRLMMSLRSLIWGLIRKQTVLPSQCWTKKEIVSLLQDGLLIQSISIIRLVLKNLFMESIK